MNEYRFKRLILIFILFLIFTTALFAVDFDFNGKWNVYSFSKRWLPNEKTFRETIENLDCLIEDEQWEFSLGNSYKVESLENTNKYTGSWEIVAFDNSNKSSIVFISENEFFITTKHSEGSTPFGLISFKKFIRFHQIRNAKIVDIPISSLIGIQQQTRDRYYFPKISAPDIVFATDSPSNPIIDPPDKNSSSDSSRENTVIIPSYTIPLSGEGNEAVDPFLDEFYYYLNAYRESYGLVMLEIDTRLENIAQDYSTIIAKIGVIDHYALSKSEFSNLCNKHELTNARLLEILVSCPDDKDPLEVLSFYQNSPSHNAALLAKKGERLGAGYVKRNGKMFFTAYVMIHK